MAVRPATSLSIAPSTFTGDDDGRNPTDAFQIRRSTAPELPGQAMIHRWLRHFSFSSAFEDADSVSISVSGRLA